MRISKLTTIVFFVFVILAIMAKIYDNDTIMLVTKPFIIPTVYFYYFIKTEKISIWFTAAIFLSFIGKGIGLIDFADEIQYLILPFFLSNLILSMMVVKRIQVINYKPINILSMLIMGIFLLYLFFAVVDLFSGSSLILQLQIIFYGCSLLILATLASYNVMNKINLENLNFGIYVICIIVSAIFYIVYNYQEKLVVLDNIHFALQMLSYYFLINFKIYQDRLE